MQTLAMPFFFTLAFTDQHRIRHQAFSLNILASVAANTMGLVMSGLYLYLRSSKASTRAGSLRAPVAPTYGAPTRRYAIRGAVDQRQRLIDAGLIRMSYSDDGAGLTSCGLPTGHIQPRRQNLPYRSAVHQMDTLSIRVPERVRRISAPTRMPDRSFLATQI